MAFNLGIFGLQQLQEEKKENEKKEEFVCAVCREKTENKGHEESGEINSKIKNKKNKNENFFDSANATEKILGWKVIKIPDEQKAKRLKESENYEIFEDRQNEKIYYLKEIPELAEEEAFLVKNVMAEFIEKDNADSTLKLVENTFDNYCRKNYLELDDEQKEYLLKILNSEIFYFSILTSLLNNDDIEEIAVIGLGRSKPVYVYEKNFGWLKTNAYFSDEQTVKNLVNKMARKIGRRLTLQTPKLNATLPDGSRLNASIQPISFLGPNLTIRKFKAMPLTPLDLINYETISPDALAFLWLALQTDCSLLICGNTGSGKTTTMNALFSFVPKNERIIITEETPEISLPQRHAVKLSVVENLSISMQNLIVDTLRMRPDRVVVGEIRNAEEVSAFIDTLLAGQGKGSYATFHAQSAREAIVRLKKLKVLEMDIAAIDLVLVQKRWNRIEGKRNSGREIRRVVEICEIISNEENDKIGLNALFEYDYKTDKLIKKNESTRVMEKIENTFSMQKEQLKKELRKREKFLVKIAGSKLSIQEFFAKINNGELI